jgi:putative redox protein
MREIAKLSAGIMYDYKVVNTAEDHTWFEDEPLEGNGQNEGPKPTELLLSSIASCMLITLRKYAQRRNWDAGEIHIDLTMSSKDDDVVIEKIIQFSGSLEDEQKERLLEISERSPVVKILSNSIEFKLIE